jgi:hypothetical protein
MTSFRTAAQAPKASCGWPAERRNPGGHRGLYRSFGADDRHLAVRSGGSAWLPRCGPSYHDMRCRTSQIRSRSRPSAPRRGWKSRSRSAMTCEPSFARSSARRGCLKIRSTESASDSARSASRLLPVDADVSKPAPTDFRLCRHRLACGFAHKHVAERRSIFGYRKWEPIALPEPHRDTARVSRAANEGIRSRPRDSRSGLECC